MRARSVALEFLIFIFVSVVAIATMATDKQHIKQGGNAAQHRASSSIKKKWGKCCCYGYESKYMLVCSWNTQYTLYIYFDSKQRVLLLCVQIAICVAEAENISWKRPSRWCVRENGTLYLRASKLADCSLQCHCQKQSVIGEQRESNQ